MTLSGRISVNKNKKLQSDEIIATQDIILEYILSNYWQDYKNFARKLSEKILKEQSTDKHKLEEVIKKFSHPFFVFNDNVTKKRFVDSFPFEEIINRLQNMPKQQPLQKDLVTVYAKETKKKKSNITFEEIFPEVKKVDFSIAKTLVDELDIEERKIQNALRDALREKGATNMIERESDSPLEIADIEPFALKIMGQSTFFAIVVKGFRSIKGKAKRVSFEAIAHQVQKAYLSKPDHIILVSAKPFKDTVITYLVEFGKNMGNKNLVIIVDPVNLARFLRARNVI